MIPCAYVKWTFTQCSLCRWKDPMLSTSTHMFSLMKKSFSLCFRICFSLQLRQRSVRNRTTNPLIMGRPALPLSHQCLLSEENAECVVEVLLWQHVLRSRSLVEFQGFVLLPCEDPFFRSFSHRRLMKRKLWCVYRSKSEFNYQVTLTNRLHTGRCIRDNKPHGVNSPRQRANSRELQGRVERHFCRVSVCWWKLCLWDLQF